MSENLTQDVCAQCGAKLAPGLRYCVSCYRPVENESVAAVHTTTAASVTGTRRADPTLVFLPEEHEAIRQRALRRKRWLIAAAIILLVALAGSLAYLLIGRQSLAEKSALAREEMTRRELSLLAEALERFRADVGRYPTNVEGIGGLSRRPLAVAPEDAEALARWAGPYIEGVIQLDPWGNDYVYITDDRAQHFELYSHGPGGEGSGTVFLRVTSSD